jgi:hypothetical protein
MGFEHREKKRKKKAAAAAAQSKSRETGSAQRKWWLTRVKIDTCCARCGGLLRKGRPMIYRHTPREALCPPCAEADRSVSYRPSLAWERARRRSRRVTGPAEKGPSTGLAPSRGAARINRPRP